MYLVHIVDTIAIVVTIIVYIHRMKKLASRTTKEDSNDDTHERTIATTDGDEQ
jgi:uncharacterized membrane protein